MAPATEVVTAGKFSGASFRELGDEDLRELRRYGVLDDRRHAGDELRRRRIQNQRKSSCK